MGTSMDRCYERCTPSSCSACLYSLACCKFCPYSFGKTIAVIPFWPVLGILALVGGGFLLLLGVAEVTRGSSGTTTQDDLIKLNNNVRIVAFAAMGALVLLDLLITYSVFSNKLRIHNINCFRAECSGFMEAAEGCRARCLSACCKTYAFFLHFISWFTLLISLALLCGVLLVASICFSVWYMCTLDPRTIDVLLKELQERTYQLNEQVDDTYFKDLVVVSNTTNSTIVCNDKDTLTSGGMYMLIGGPIMLLAQVVVLVSYNTVSEVSIRHLKHIIRNDKELLPHDPDEASRVRMASRANLGVSSKMPEQSNRCRAETAQGGEPYGGGAYTGGMYPGGAFMDDGFDRGYDDPVHTRPVAYSREV
ncbi:hypothetical protein AB1Y20_012686 [Prymnesium parvum]|uniref:Protein S-acyltransferase n=1 Tax=Prymnesium parvum TaxID=97485 RepID=A0AB34IKK0_PRYPA